MPSQSAAKFGLPHFTWLCINPKESEDVKLAGEVIALIPEFLDRPNVLGIGEIGLNKNTRNELQVLEQHIDLALRIADQAIVLNQGRVMLAGIASELRRRRDAFQAAYFGQMIGR